MAERPRSTLFDFLDDIAARDVAEGRPRPWTDGDCPQCRQLATHGPPPETTAMSSSAAVTWVFLSCGVFQAPLAA
jgi:hypothetical protein